MNDDIVVMLRTPVGCTPPSKWELAAAKEIERLRKALKEIEATPYMVTNDSESLRHTIKSIQATARRALKLS